MQSRLPGATGIPSRNSNSVPDSEHMILNVAREANRPNNRHGKQRIHLHCQTCQFGELPSLVDIEQNKNFVNFRACEDAEREMQWQNDRRLAPAPRTMPHDTNCLRENG